MSEGNVQLWQSLCCCVVIVLETSSRWNFRTDEGSFFLKSSIKGRITGVIFKLLSSITLKNKNKNKTHFKGYFLLDISFVHQAWSEAFFSVSRMISPDFRGTCSPQARQGLRVSPVSTVAISLGALISCPTSHCTALAHAELCSLISYELSSALEETSLLQFVPKPMF